MTVVDQLQTALLAARRSRDAAATSALRTALAALANAEAVPEVSSAGEDPRGAVGVGASDVDRREVGEAERRALVAAEVDDLEHAATAYDDVDPDRAAAARHGAAVLREVLAAG